MGKFTIKQLLDLNSEKSNLALNNLCFVSEEIIDFRGLEGIRSEGLGFEIRGIALEGKRGCVGSKQQRSDDHEKGEAGLWPKRKRFLERYKLEKIFSEPTVDSEDSSKRAVAAIEGKWGCVNSKQQRVALKRSGGDGHGDGHGKDEMGSWLKRRRRTLEPCKAQQQDSEIEIRVVEKVKIWEGVVELDNKNTRTGSPASDCQPKASTASNVESEESTRKALRAEMIKATFADTIRKALEQKLNNRGNKAVKESLKRRKADNSTEIRASKTMLEPKTSKVCGGVVELANKGIGTGSLPSDSQPEVFPAPHVDSENFTGKASRAEMIKSRFAETILKAQEQKILSQRNKVEKKRLESRKANTEAEIRAAECKLKEQRQKDREAARIAIDNMGRTVEWNFPLDVMQEFERLIGIQCGVDRTPFARDRFSW